MRASEAMETSLFGFGIAAGGRAVLSGHADGVEQLAITELTEGVY
ncbi:hypothetical protein [Mycobacterium uberis]|nr:hypothetical protein [Mycobacterium uberis]